MTYTVEPRSTPDEPSQKRHPGTHIVRGPYRGAVIITGEANAHAVAHELNR